MRLLLAHAALLWRPFRVLPTAKETACCVWENVGQEPIYTEVTIATGVPTISEKRMVVWWRTPRSGGQWLVVRGVLRSLRAICGDCGISTRGYVRRGTRKRRPLTDSRNQGTWMILELCSPSRCNGHRILPIGRDLNQQKKEKKKKLWLLSEKEGALACARKPPRMGEVCLVP